ncbi:nitrogenase cofactor biosynthesis protein NifB (plasmid) [Rhizobium leguminosarum]|uniref:nitrogenase cofactor biosynthesis protein NifB n=1 Tax=Rhizobium leguminosarum TaxID=384 RepID=UPI000485A093|nr:nitrogenase cofactor biosynthesis protein NifB [Rhizobium leguminosarum]UIK01388.1 nitrogenase cofactor biosynthesis protein NifB [Rhizobium leguminosarum]WFT90725.1 nitrogenase cofactor biosynthesis protein NifB [Rhizobium leguminosarum]
MSRGMSKRRTTNTAPAARESETTTFGGYTSSSRGSSKPNAMDQAIIEKIKDHPCFSREAHLYFARMHLAVAPACNIQCNYCNRKYDCANESRPGVASNRLTPDQAVRRAMAVASEVPQLSVVGIAGPGDACYDWKMTKATLIAIAREIPDIKLCVSTNGLALPEHVDELVDMNVGHVTITINMVDPKIGTKIYPWIFYDGRRYNGIDASRILHERQMLGLEMLTERGILTKVNSVMIPGVNDEHLIEVNKWVNDRGAFMHNVTPLISERSHGTFYGLNRQRCPAPLELNALRDRLEGATKVMRHCRQCRADAVGLLSDDRASEFTLGQLPAEATYDSGKRHAYRQLIEHERRGQTSETTDATIAVSLARSNATLFIAVTTKGGGRINELGQAKELQIFSVCQKGIGLIGHLKLDPYCLGGWGEETTLNSIIEALEGIDFLLCFQIGIIPRNKLARRGVQATSAYGNAYLEQAIDALYTAYLSRGGFSGAS